MRYFISFPDSRNFVYSIDKLVIHGKFLYNSFYDFQRRLNTLMLKYVVSPDELPFDICFLRDTYWESRKSLTYINNFKFDLIYNGDVTTFWLGTHFKSYDNTLLTWKLELNPNKCMPCNFVSDLFFLLLDLSKNDSVSVGEYDIAVDMPISRDDLYLVKDQRKYQSVVNSAIDKTEYLGCRHTMGFCKLYNKQLESKLDSVMSRFEMTCTNLSVLDIMSRFPTVYYACPQLSLPDLKLSDTDKFILRTLVLDPLRISELSYDKRRKMKQALESAFTILLFDKSCISNLVAALSDLNTFFRGVEIM